MSLDPVALRDIYDTRVRAYLPTRLPPTAVIEQDGPLLRLTGVDRRGFLTYRDLGGLTGAELDALIGRQRDLFTARGEAVEWKLHGHDQPADLPQRLRAAGFEPEEQETVVIGLAAPLAALPSAGLSAGVQLREVRQRVDLDRIMRMEEAVWGGDHSWHAAALEEEIATDPDGITVVVAETGPGPDDPVVSAGWVRYVPGTGFATLWGGSTRPEWRGRGIYRALVAHRARLAVERGFTHLQVDASDDSRPILQRLGFVAVTTTTPYVFRPPTART